MEKIITVSLYIGALGKRTRFQENDLSQLIIEVTLEDGMYSDVQPTSRNEICTVMLKKIYNYRFINLFIHSMFATYIVIRFLRCLSLNILLIVVIRINTIINISKLS